MPDGSFEFRVAHECIVKSYEIVWNLSIYKE
jgi:hypothetical protein